MHACTQALLFVMDGMPTNQTLMTWRNQQGRAGTCPGRRERRRR